VPECTNTMEAAGLEGPHRWGVVLPNTPTKPKLPVRYPELVMTKIPSKSDTSAHDHMVEYGGFRTVLWDAPKEQQSKM